MRCGFMRLQLSLALVGAAAGCGQGGRAPVAQSGPLPAGVAAEVGTETVSTNLVEAIASGQGVAPKVARDRAVSDAVFAAYARDRLGGSGLVESAERSALARALLESLRREAEAKGPPTDREVEAVTSERWQELARPPLSRTIHAVVVVKTPSDDAKGRRVAERVAAAVKGVTEAKEFERLAKQVDAEGLELRVEQLLPVAADGRVADPAAQPGAEPRRFDPVFARAAAAIPEVGEQSPIVRSEFGYHVILLSERLPEIALSLEQRRSLLEREIIDRRARVLLDEIGQRVAGSAPVGIDRAADDLMARVQVAR